MKIIHVTECFSGGIFEFLVQLINGLKEHQHIVIYSKRENTPLNFQKKFPPNTEFIQWKNAQREVRPLKDLKALLELKFILKNIQNKTVIHLHSSKAGFIGRLVAYITGESEKVIYTAHGVSFLRLDVSQIKRALYMWLEKIACFFGGIIIACSESERQAFIRRNISFVKTINNGVKIEDQDGLIQECSVEDEKTIVVSIGRLSVQKNPVLFNEIAKAFENDHSICFCWIGDGELRKKLISNNIEITGWLPRESVIKKLKKADIYLSTALWEGMPLSVLEAMTMGKALVLSDCVGNRDLIERNGYLFSEIEEGIKAIRNLKENKNMRVEFGKQSIDNIHNYFSAESMVNAYRNIYNDCTLKSRSRKL